MRILGIVSLSLLIIIVLFELFLVDGLPFFLEALLNLLSIGIILIVRGGFIYELHLVYNPSGILKYSLYRFFLSRSVRLLSFTVEERVHHERKADRSDIVGVG